MLRLPILCYHKVGPESEEGRYLNVEPERLRAHIRFLKRQGYQFALAKSLAKTWSERTVCLTFDDAYHSTLTHGIEAMLAEGVRATLFATAGLVGKASTWDGGRASALADADLLRAAAERGFEIGNHSYRHPRLANLTDDEQALEIESAHLELVKWGLVARSIAYPYGSFNASSLTAARKGGYEVGLGLSRRPALESDDKLALPRIVMGFGDSVAGLIYRMHLRWKLPASRQRPEYIP